jgi:RNA polymerase sigma-70 factor (ECF subfamily)
VPVAYPHHLTDEALLQQSANGDSAAFDELVPRHESAVYRFITTLGVTGADAEDALQETFISAWRGAASFYGSGRVRSWLLSIARNVVRHHRRRRVGEPRAVASLEDLALRAGWGEPSAPGLDESVADAAELIDRALDQLPDDERECLLLRDIEGLSGEETARMLELTIPAMKSRLHRARLHLAALVREDTDART